MKRVRAAFRKLTQSKFDEEVERLHAESRAEATRAVKEGRGWEGLKENAALLGLGQDGAKPKMIFGAKGTSARKRR